MKQPRLVGLKGPVKGQIHFLTENEISIGRDPGNAIVINDSNLSRYHCRFIRVDESYVIEDFGSRNGTLVNEARLNSPRELENGDCIYIGRCEFVFWLESDSEETV